MHWPHGVIAPTMTRCPSCSRHAGAELVDDADRLVADDAARRHGILALEDVDVGAADRRRGDADQGLTGPDVRHRLVVENDASGCGENCGFHDGPFLRQPLLPRAGRCAAR